MTTLAIALAKIAVLEARIDALEGGRRTDSGSGGGARGPAGGGDALPDHLLENTWADRTIPKDPKQWKGRSQVNRRYSQAPAEWLEMAASNADFKAQKGREEVPVRLNNKGKPWHESDTFEAKLLRAWANRARQRPAPAPPKSAPADPGGDDDFNFGFNAESAKKPDDVGF